MVSDTNEVATDRVVIRTDPYTNILPQADAGIDQTVATGDLVQLDATASSDADGTIIKYRWHQSRGPNVQLIDSQTAVSSFQAPPNAELAFSLKIEDNAGAVATDSIVIRVEPYTNQPPVADAGVDQTVAAGETVQLDGSASNDADGVIVRYIWTQNRGPSVVLQDSRTATPSFTMPANAELAFTLTVIDESGVVTRDGVLVRSAVNNNQPPIANAGPDLIVIEGEMVQLDGSTSSDPDGEISRFIWWQRSGPTV
ncbi:MAG: PKD domain-containing protein [Candidatus Thiodiazotropha sp.]